MVLDLGFASPFFNGFALSDLIDCIVAGGYRFPLFISVILPYRIETGKAVLWVDNRLYFPVVKYRYNNSPIKLPLGG